jgi:hypothetical protein
MCEMALIYVLVETAASVALNYLQGDGRKRCEVSVTD